MLQESCFDCRFFTALALAIRSDDFDPIDRDKTLQGHCRRNPPVVGHYRGEGKDLEYDYGQWPLVLSDDWCGAFEPCQRVSRDNAAQTRHVCAGREMSRSIEQNYDQSDIEDLGQGATVPPREK